MTKPTSTPEKPSAAEEEVARVDMEEDEYESDDDLKKNIYNEIPEYDDVDEVKMAVECLDSDAVILRQQNLANENLYSEIRPCDERFENALYMAHEKQQQQQTEEKQKAAAVVGGSVFPSMSPKTRSFFPASPLPSIPSSSKMIPEEPEPSWCCGTRRRRRRSLVLGLFLTTLFLLFLCVALLVRMYVPHKDDDDGRQGFDDGISTAEFFHQESSPENGWESAEQVAPTIRTPTKTHHSESICTSWQGRRRLSLSCPTTDGKIEIVRAFYGWSHSEAVCKQVTGDTYCKITERDIRPRCNGDNACDFWADASGLLIGCHGLHDFLEVDYNCVTP